MTYSDFINDILSTRGRFIADANVYKEKHHIKPKSIGGTNSEDNMIDLFASEHYEAHKLLAQENPDDSALCYAWWMMAHIDDAHGREYVVSAEEYEEAKILAAKHMSELHRGKCLSQAHRDKIGQAGRGRQLSAEQKKQISDRMMGNVYNVGRVISEETRQKISDSNKGKPSPNKGKHLSQQTKDLIREANLGKEASDETREKIGVTSRQRGMSEEYRIKMSTANGGQPIYCPQLNEEFYGPSDVERKYSIPRSYVSACLYGHQKSAGRHPTTGEKLNWVFIENNLH